ncbi:hypothetical protein [Sphingopyxis chilensis]|uniref:hypothetical protein n=1 Tax=Sphingopyxis chilensis TaxID=180400 RepID=UPI002DDD4D86|nr:hypothetical protein [Sphingopyxis chilensis]
MRTWAILLAGMLLWGLHFFALYGIGEFWGSGAAARVAIGMLSIACLAAMAGLAFEVGRRTRGDGLARWRTRLARGGLLLGAIAVIWQTLPMLLAR